MALKWTQEFEDELREHYAEGVAACKKCLKKFTVGAIQQHACRLGLTRKLHFWSAEEDKVLLKFFEKRGRNYCADKLPNKNLNQVSARAYRLGLKWKRPPLINWTDKELELLRQRYQEIGAKGCAALLKGKTATQCGKRAREMGLYTYKMKIVRDKS